MRKEGVTNTGPKNQVSLADTHIVTMCETRTYILTVKFSDLQLGIPKYGAVIETFVVTNVVVLSMAVASQSAATIYSLVPGLSSSF